jgi:hypothetical protein
MLTKRGFVNPIICKLPHFVANGMLGVMSSDNPHAEIGKRLRAFRNHLGLTQKAFVDRRNFSPTQYNKDNDTSSS